MRWPPQPAESGGNDQGCCSRGECVGGDGFARIQRQRTRERRDPAADPGCCRTAAVFPARGCSKSDYEHDPYDWYTVAGVVWRILCRADPWNGSGGEAEWLLSPCFELARREGRIR